MTDTPKPDTSVEAVEHWAAQVDKTLVLVDGPYLAALFRQLRKELTEAQEKQREMVKWLAVELCPGSFPNGVDDETADSFIEEFNASRKEQG